MVFSHQVRTKVCLGFIATLGTMTITGEAPPDTATRAGK
jgi:hypothetical protein